MKVMPLPRIGWMMSIRHVEPIPGGWRAGVHVHPVVVMRDWRAHYVENFHIETYTFKDGKLALESEGLDPHPPTDPNEGLMYSCPQSQTVGND
jgi:hypothetical protein